MPVIPVGAAGILRYIKEYPDKRDFYELFGTNIRHFVLQKYAQIRRIRLTIDTAVSGD